MVLNCQLSECPQAIYFLVGNFIVDGVVNEVSRALTDLGFGLSQTRNCTDITDLVESFNSIVMSALLVQTNQHFVLRLCLTPTSEWERPHPKIQKPGRSNKFRIIIGLSGDVKRASEIVRKLFGVNSKALFIWKLPTNHKIIWDCLRTNLPYFKAMGGVRMLGWERLNIPSHLWFGFWGNTLLIEREGCRLSCCSLKRKPQPQTVNQLLQQNPTATADPDFLRASILNADKKGLLVGWEALQKSWDLSLFQRIITNLLSWVESLIRNRFLGMFGGGPNKKKTSSRILRASLVVRIVTAGGGSEQLGLCLLFNLSQLLIWDRAGSQPDLA
ncbi:hypothetical protein TPPAVE_208 [Candidatus Tremblaya phenacola PAVE]|nr:hypothetical protein TPPAVE_208 [Candidatus Tremblaya phenacola PAVE]